MTAFHAAYTCWPTASRSYHPLVVGGISAFICWDTFTYLACQYLQSTPAPKLPRNDLQARVDSMDMR